MTTRPTFEEAAPRLIDCFRYGVSIHDAALQVGVPQRTVERWLSRGRREPESKYGPFAQAAAEARSAETDAGPMDAAQLRVQVSRAARRGSVPAMRLYWEFLEADKRRAAPASSFEELDPIAQARDELAARRKANG